MKPKLSFREYLCSEEGSVAEWAVLTGLLILLAIAIVRLFGSRIYAFLAGIFKREVRAVNSENILDS